MTIGYKQNKDSSNISCSTIRIDRVIKNSDFQLLLLLILLNCFTLFFSPLLSLYGSLFLLAALSNYIDESSRKILGFIGIISGSLVIASRQVGAFSSDDMIRYYRDYIELLNGNYSRLFFYGGGIEILPMIFFLVIGKVLGVISPSILTFIIVFIITLIFWLWLEKYGLKSITEHTKGLCIASALLFFSFTNASQLCRQMLASVIILHAVSNNSKKKRILLLFLASISHIISLPIYVITRALLYKTKKFYIAFAVLIIPIFVFMKYGISFFLNYLGIGFLYNKVSYYFVPTIMASSASIGSIKIMIALIVAIISFPSNYKNIKNWISYVIGSVFLYIVFLPYPFVSDRLGQLLLHILSGYILFLGMKKIPTVFKLVLCLYIVYQFTILGPLYSVKSNSFVLWHYFPWINYLPFFIT